MQAEERRRAILDSLRNTDTPVSATALARRFAAGRKAKSRHSSSFRTARNASVGICTVPSARIFFLPSFCFSSSFFFRVTSPP